MISPHADSVDLDDATLVRRVRDGDTDAYARLFERHRRAAVAVAGRLAGPGQAEDITAEAFANVLDAIKRGLGPTLNFRAYLLTTVRSIWKNGIRTAQRCDLVEDYDLLPPVDQLTLVDDPDQRFDNGAVAVAFRSLPDRWQAVLWYTSVEGLSHRDVAARLGINANAVAALSFRAREGLRHAYLAAHLHETDDPACARWAPELPALARGSLDKRKLVPLRTHLEHCVRCQAALADLEDVNTRLGVLLLPIGLGAHAAGLDAMVLRLPRRAPARGARHLRSRVTHGKSMLVTAAATGLVGAAMTVVVLHVHERGPVELRDASLSTTPFEQPADDVSLDRRLGSWPASDETPTIRPTARRSSPEPERRRPTVPLTVDPPAARPPARPPRVVLPPVESLHVDLPHLGTPPVDPPPVDPPPVDPPPVDPPPVDPPEGPSPDAGLGQATADQPHAHGLTRVRIPVTNLRPGAVVTVTVTNIYGRPLKLAGHWTCPDTSGGGTGHDDLVASTTVDCTWRGSETASTDLVLGVFAGDASQLAATIVQAPGVIDPALDNNTTELTLTP